jgi:23S rRNA (uracil1939-C5)-methyltransferase
MPVAPSDSDQIAAGEGQPADQAPDRLSLSIDDLSHDGRGVGRHGGRVIFVAGALPGDTVEIRLTPARNKQWQGQLLGVSTPSPHRRRAPCILADHCGGCSLQALEDRAEQQWKQRSVEQTLQRLAGLCVPMRPLLASGATLGYRNRAVIPLERKPDGTLRAGFYRRGSHRIVNMNHCPVLDPRIDALVAPLKAELRVSGWPVDRHGSDEGGLRHLALRVGHHSGEVLITLVSSHARLQDLQDRAHDWMERWPELVGVGLNLQPEPSNLIFGAETGTIAGRGWLEDDFAGLRYRIAADTFFQVNTPQAERVVPLLLEALNGPPGSLVDAYCGIGTYSLPLAAVGWWVHGIEQQAAAVELARHNAAINGLQERASFEAAPVAAALTQRLAGSDALLLDPPRKGLDGPTLAAILACPPIRILYLSCNPATLARDLARLVAEAAYAVRSVQPIDFFPNTSHVETLAVLEREPRP